MAERGSKKELSVRHEEHIAKALGGKRSKSSGAAITDKGDVRAGELMVECKMTMTNNSTLLKQFTKITEEAYEEGKTPAMALRFYDPDNAQSDPNGWIDLMVLDLGTFLDLIYD